MLVKYTSQLAAYIEQFRNSNNNQQIYNKINQHVDITKITNYFLSLESKLSHSQSNISPITLLFTIILLLITLKITISITFKFIKLIFSIRLCNKHSKSDLKNLEKAKEFIENYTKTNIKSGKTKPIFDFKDSKQEINDIVNKITRLCNSDEDKYADMVLSGTLYESDKELNYIASKAAEYYSYSNLLHPDVYCSARHIEAEVIKINIGIFNGIESETCGCTTYSGTESTLLALMSYRNMKNDQGVEIPEVIISGSANAIYYKIADMINIKLRFANVDNQGRIDIKSAKSLINHRTCCIVGLFPNLAYGTLDNIELLSELAIAKSTYLHIDASYGGYLAGFRHYYGNSNLPKFDFSLAGVSSLTTDTNRYGKSPTGISILLYRNKEIRKKQYFMYPKWMGGFYVTPSLAGSRTASMVVASYMVYLYTGEGKYKEQYKLINMVTNDVITKFNSKRLSELEIIGNPEMSIIAFSSSKKGLITAIYQLMKEKKYTIGLNIGMCNKSGLLNKKNEILKKDSISFCVTSNNLESVDGMLVNDIVECYDKAMEGKVEDNDEVKMLKITGGLPLELQNEAVKKMVDAYLDMDV